MSPGYRLAAARYTIIGHEQGKQAFDKSKRERSNLLQSRSSMFMHSGALKASELSLLAVTLGPHVTAGQKA